MTARNGTRFEVRAGGTRVRGVIGIKSFLTVIQKVERFPSWKMTFPVDVVLEERRSVTSVNLGVEDTVHVPSPFAVLGDDGFAGFLTLARERIVGYMT